jgi:FG-GAP-like repeat
MFPRLAVVALFLSLSSLSFAQPLPCTEFVDAPRVYDAPGGELTAHDFDGDGNQDVLSGPQEAISIAYGRGDGSFDAPQVLRSIPGYDLAVSDLTGDGRADIVAVTPEGVVLYVNAGNRTFTSRTVANETYAKIIGAGDVAGNALNDLVVMQYGLPIRTLINRGTQFETVDAAPAETNPYGLGDFDGDGFVDLLAPTQQYGVRFLRGDDTGRFTEERIVWKRSDIRRTSTI